MDELRFYLDENVTNDVADGLRIRGIDALTTPEADNIGLDDKLQLAFAIAEDRVVITQDRDFLRLSKSGYRTPWHVYWKPQSRNIKYIIRELLRIHREMTPEDMKNHVEFL